MKIKDIIEMSQFDKYAINTKTQIEWDMITELIKIYADFQWNYGKWENNKMDSVITFEKGIKHKIIESNEIKYSLEINTCNIYWIEPSPKHIYDASQFIEDWREHQLNRILKERKEEQKKYSGGLAEKELLFKALKNGNKSR